MLSIPVVEDNPNLRPALVAGLNGTRRVTVAHDCDTAEEALAYRLRGWPDAILTDVQLARAMSGIEATVAIRREFPRQPTVLYSIRDDDAYYRAFRLAGILSHYAYVEKSSFLLPKMIVSLLEGALASRSFIDPEIEARVQEVRYENDQSPMALLEPNQQTAARG